LIDNAIKYSERPGTITLKVEEKDNHEWRVIVKDEGKGIDPEDLPYIFGAFFRGRDSEDAEGLGLGLATVKAIIEGHGGRIFVESEPGKGATFVVHLPK